MAAFSSTGIYIVADTPRTLPDWHSTLPDSPILQHWLLNEGSLTRLLRELSDGDFRVQPVCEGWQPLRADECQALDCTPGTEGWVREVFLLGQQQPWIYARSVASRAALEADGFDLAGLGSRSLGELLFSDDAFTRGAFEVCCLPADARPARLLEGMPGSAPLWARRSCFARNGLRVLVAEAFLPAFWNRLDYQPPGFTAS